ncbi:outer membrane protein assembly factor BamC [Sulfuricaulis sp.]|jgi:outer membrane protein assembly factor BamC|uniref:outer membrane protein assembly factor BamC n=1 Tax=Sulfuricaulis sp. TaxID=2003553 RepID=UPI00355A4F62
MTKRFATILLCLLAALAVSACQTIAEKRKIDYKATRTLPPLDIPPDLSAPEGVKEPVEPAPGTATYSGFVTEKGTLTKASVGGDVLPDFSGIRMGRDGQMRWLVVQMSPEQLWPKVREFVLNSGLIIDKENPQTGIIETDWSENRAKVGTSIQKLLAKSLGTLYSTGTRDKYRIRLERDTAPGTTDVYISQFGMQEVVVNQQGISEIGETRWEPRPNDPGLEAEMLQLLMVSLGVKDDKAKSIIASLAATPSAERAKLSHEGAATSLSLSEDFERAWRRVGLALDRTSFTVEDRDRSKGIYYVRYIDPDNPQKKKGFFRRMFSGKDKDPTNEYQILVKGDATTSRVDVLSKDGAPEQSKTSERILTLLYDQLK